MIGYCTLVSEGRGVTLRGKMMCGLPLYAAEVRAGRWENHRLKRGGGYLARTGVRRVLAPEGFPYWALLRERGLERVDPAPLLLRLAPMLVLERLRSGRCPPERARVVLRGQRAEQLRPAAEALCPFVGTLVLAAPDSEWLARRLRVNYGMAPQAAETFSHADLELHFGPDLPRRSGQVLEFWPGAPAPEGAILSVRDLPAPEVCETLPLLEVLWETGRLLPEQVRVDFA